MNGKKIKAPFPYFGGKSRIADTVWDVLGGDEVKHYIEPFCGSCAVLLKRPNYTQKMVETVNDADCHIANVWRCLKLKPEETAYYADEPVNHLELNVKREYLRNNADSLRGLLYSDLEACDPKMAGFYIWASSCWIGSGLTRKTSLPLVGNSGNGIHGKVPFDNNSGRLEHIYEWFNHLSYRLRKVRVVCGDWTQVCGGNWQNNIGLCGMFFDPPYSGIRTKNIYGEDDLEVYQKVNEWVSKRGSDPKFRIVVAGYDGEHNNLVEDYGWSVVEWKANGGFSNLARNGSKAKGKQNARLERLWLSPHCIKK